MPFSYNANITDLNDAILAAVNEQVALETGGLNTRLNTVQTDVSGLDVRVTSLENSEPTPEPIPTPEPEPEPTPEPQPETPTVGDQEQTILNGVNAFRAERGLAPVAISSKMSVVAENWTQNMANNWSMVHNPNYSSQLPAGASATSEIIAYHYGTGATGANELVRLWRESAVHANIMVGNYNYVGIGSVVKDGYTWGTVNFGAYATSPDGGSSTTPKVNSYTATRTSTGINFKANVSNIANVTLRVSGSPITTQVGWYYPSTASSTGAVSILANEQNSTSSYYWQLEDSADRTKVLASGQVGPY